MKNLGFNDGRSINIQSITKAEGCLHIRTILTTSEKLKALFMDSFATQKMTVSENGVPEKEAYENYTELSYIKEETGGIWEVEMLQKGASIKEQLGKVEESLSATNSLAEDVAEQVTAIQLALCELYEGQGV